MFLSIIIPFYNNTAYLNRLFITLEDYINRDCEIIIIDDNSSLTAHYALIEKVESYNANNIRVLRNEKNYGPSFSRQLGVNIALGSFIAFLDADDGWLKNRAFILCNLMLEKNIDICGGGHHQIDAKHFFDIRNKKLGSFKNIESLSFLNFLFKNYYATSSVIIRKEIFSVDSFNTKLRFSEDYEFWRRVVLNRNALLLEPSGSLCFKHVYVPDNNNLGLSSQTKKMLKSEIYGILMLISNSNVPKSLKFLVLPAVLFSILKYFKRIIHIEVSKLLK